VMLALLGRALRYKSAGLGAISAAAKTDTALSRAAGLALVNGAGQLRMVDMESGSLARARGIAISGTRAVRVVAISADAAANKLAKQVYFLEMIGLEAYVVCHLLHPQPSATKLRANKCIRDPTFFWLLILPRYPA